MPKRNRSALASRAPSTDDARAWTRDTRAQQLQRPRRRNTSLRRLCLHSPTHSAARAPSVRDRRPLTCAVLQVLPPKLLGAFPHYRPGSTTQSSTSRCPPLHLPACRPGEPPLSRLGASLQVYLLTYPILQWSIGKWLMTPDEPELLSAVATTQYPSAGALSDIASPAARTQPCLSAAVYEQLLDADASQPTSLSLLSLRDSARAAQAAARPPATALPPPPSPPPRRGRRQPSSERLSRLLRQAAVAFLQKHVLLPPVVGILLGLACTWDPARHHCHHCRPRRRRLTPLRRRWTLAPLCCPAPPPTTPPLPRARCTIPSAAARLGSGCRSTRAARARGRRSVSSSAASRRSAPLQCRSTWSCSAGAPP